MIPQVALLAHGAGSSVIATYPPSAVLTTFDYNGQGAAPAQLYDGNDATPSADSRGLQADTAAAYDLGSAKAVSNVRIKVSDTFGFSALTTFKIQYSDTSLSTGWTDSGATISVASGTGSIANQAVSSGSHRYWRIIYQSGSINTNAWIGELSFQGP